MFKKKKKLIIKELLKKLIFLLLWSLIMTENDSFKIAVKIERLRGLAYL